MNTKLLPALAGLILSLTTTTQAVAQENLVALGRVNSAGALINGVSPIGGTISMDHPGTGDYEITVDAPGAFTAAGIGDFLVMGTIRSGIATDRGIASRIVSVSPDSLVVAIATYDLEDSTAPNSAPSVNVSFQFAIHRLPSGTTVPASSRFLYAAGSVTGNGTLKKAAVADGSALAVSSPGEGDYLLTFTKTGAFAGFDLEDYLVFVTSGSQSAIQDSIPAATADSKNNDLLNLTVNTADGQDGGDVPVDEDNEFHFAVYRIDEVAPAIPAESSLLVGMASVQGSNGLLRRGTSSYPGATITVDYLGAGRYRLVFSSPGRFAGRDLDDFAIQVHPDNVGIDDNHTSARAMFIGSDSLTIDVRTNDLQTNGDGFGVAENNDFYLVLHEAFAESQPDLLIGNKPALTTMRGNDRHNTNAAGQRARIFTKPSGSARVHFAAQNDGNTTDSLQVRGRTGNGLVKTRCFRLTGGKQNVTAAFRSAGDLVENVRPSAATRYFVQSVLPPDSPKSRAKVRLHARPGAGAAPLDSAQAEIVSKP